MDSYLQSTACKGRRPHHLSSFRHRPRMALLTKMMRERSVVRFLVAPHSFGKTTLALDYAESIFSLEHVFWIDATNPCFLRDLDKGIIGSGLLSQNTRVSLVVFDDIPYLDTSRCAAFSRSCDLLLERGWEVIATTSPTCDVFGACQIDKIRLDADALLVSDEEMMREYSESGRTFDPTLSVAPAERVASIYWGSEGCYRSFLLGIVREELPSELLLPLFSILVLQRGTFADLSAVAQSWHEDTAQLLAYDRPYLGIDLRANMFRCSSFTLSAVAEAFDGLLDKMVLSSQVASSDALIVQLCDVLVKAGKGDRACAAMSMCTQAARSQWLVARQESLLCAGCLLAAQQLFMSLVGCLGKRQERLFALCAWRIALLGDQKTACEQGTRVAFDVRADTCDRALAGLLLAHFGDASLRPRVCNLLAKVSDFDVSDPGTSVERLVEMRRAALPQRWGSAGVHRYHLELLSTACLCLESRVALGLSFVCEKCRQAIASGLSDALDLAAVLAVMALRSIEQLRAREALMGALADTSHKLIACTHALIATVSQAGRATLAVWILIKHAEAFGLLGKCSHQQILPPLFATALGVLGKDIEAQRTAYIHKTNSSVPLGEGISFDEVALSTSCAQAKRPGVEPQLYVSLFGGLELNSGGKAINSELFRRQKVQTLCALLVINRGKEIARVALESSLWPDSPAAKARNNLYSTWSMLRKALSTDMGTCPYLIRLQHSCKINTSLVSSDVFELDTLCNRLLFSPPDTEVFTQIYAEINALYTGDLLPGEADNAFISFQRNEIRTRLVDALVSAAGALYRVREYPCALQFARAALRHDETREDVYKALIQVQMAIGQRSSAMQTYFRCRSYLVGELGIDPSSNMEALYNQMLTDDAPTGYQLALPLA
ncbi:MAG: bacterial transcriptional activator domain-containing protein [Eggerthellaceae bacterium]